MSHNDNTQGIQCELTLYQYIVTSKYAFMTRKYNNHRSQQSELRPPIPRNSVESDHGCTLMIYFDNAGDYVTLTLYNVMLTSQKQA